MQEGLRSRFLQNEIKDEPRRRLEFRRVEDCNRFVRFKDRTQIEITTIIAKKPILY